jgi:UDP-2,3-diacylglucosamine hydrolase
VARVLFASDLHLATGRPAAVDRFLRFVGEEAAHANALYVLGDLFEYWIGDDELSAPDGDPLAKQVAAAFRALTLGGVPLYFMHGNRDFLVGEAFARDCGAQLLADPAVREVGGVATVLMHGDTLCTDDRDYMAWRATARSEAWQRELLAAPLALRRERARALREQSEASKKGKTAEIMDVNAEAVREAFERHRVSRMIHGHTHRPGRHLLEIGGRACERWVLPDWYERGGYLLVEGGAPRLVYF